MILDLIDKHIEMDKTLKSLFISLVSRINTDTKYIKRLNERCFIMQSSALSAHNLSASAYDTEYQLRVILDLIHKTPLDKLRLKLNELIDKRRMWYDGQTIFFNPAIIFQLQRIIQGDLKWLRKHLKKERSERKSKKLSRDMSSKA